MVDQQKDLENAREELSNLIENLEKEKGWNLDYIKQISDGLKESGLHPILQYGMLWRIIPLLDDALFDDYTPSDAELRNQILGYESSRLIVEYDACLEFFREKTGETAKEAGGREVDRVVLEEFKKLCGCIGYEVKTEDGILVFCGGGGK